MTNFVDELHLLMEYYKGKEELLSTLAAAFCYVASKEGIQTEDAITYLFRRLEPETSNVYVVSEVAEA